MRDKPPSAAERRRSHRRTLAGIGARVRALRDERGMPRRELAQASGVSARFLAELEGGAGNISVARLADVELALGVSPGALLARHEGAQEPGLRAAVDSLLDGRSDAELRELRDWMESRFLPSSGPIVALLGVRGAGKSTVGRRLAARLEVPFHELDGRIEAAAGLSLAELFELHGEAYYRRVQRETLASYLSSTEKAVLATGGSVVNDPEAYRLLKRRCVTVWLKARAEDHWERVVQQGDHRPMARHPHAMQELRELLAARERLYAEADHVVDTAGAGVEAVVERIARLLAPRR